MDNLQQHQKKALQDLQTIKTFIEEGQKSLGDNGFHFILWGLLIPCATLVFYLLLDLVGTTYPLFITAFWPVVSLCGALVSILVGVFSGKKDKIKGYAQKISTQLWIGFLITLFIISIIPFLLSGQIVPGFLGYIALVLGLAYWVYGSIIQLVWFRTISFVWWATAILIAVSTEWFTVSVIMAAATFVCSFIPGLILFRRQATRST